MTQPAAPLPDIPRKPLEPIRYLHTTEAEGRVVSTLTQTISDHLRALPSVEKSHTTVDYVDLKIEGGIYVRVHVQALR